MSTGKVLIVGVGPFGLSISAHLRDLGVDHKVVGRLMETWRTHMPTGMNLKSEPYSSDIASPKAGYSVREFCRQHGLDYNHRGWPLSLERFIDYADWYGKQLVPEVTDATVTEISAAGSGFRVAFADAEPVTATQIILATGVLPYRYLPDELSGLSADLVSHTIDHAELGQFQGRRVAVVGAGQSALETAALLRENGAVTQVIARKPVISWNDRNPDHISLLGHIRRPVTQLGEGWRSVVWNSPMAFRRLPQDMRTTKARTVLGPAGAWWLKDRIDGIVDILTGHRVRGAEPSGSGVRLLLDGPKQSALDVDHVIAGTGFRVDLARLPFLTDGLQAKIATLTGYPVLTRAGESTVPGLYFAGAHSAVSLGPSERFVAGTHNIADKLARSVARSARA